MRGKWAEGLPPRHFSWVIRDKLAVSERPGGYGPNHRRVRRTEEIIWLQRQGFDRVVSILPSPHNLHAYEEVGMPCSHVPFAPGDDPAEVLGVFWPDLASMVGGGQRVLLHGDEISDRLSGVVAGYLVHAGLVREQPRAIAMVEHLVSRQMGPPGRELVAVAGRLAERAASTPRRG